MNFIKSLFGYGKPKEQEKPVEVKPRRSPSAIPSQTHEHHHHHHHQNQPRSPSSPASPNGKSRERLSKESVSKDKGRVKKSKQREMRNGELSKEKMETTDDEPKREEKTRDNIKKEERTKDDNRKEERTKDDVKKQEKTKDDTAVTKTRDDALKKIASTPTVDETPQTTTPEKKNEPEKDKAPKRPVTKPKGNVNNEDALTDFEKVAVPSRPAISKSRNRNKSRFSGDLKPVNPADGIKETQEDQEGGNNECTADGHQLEGKGGKKNDEATQEMTECTREDGE